MAAHSRCALHRLLGTAALVFAGAAGAAQAQNAPDEGPPADELVVTGIRSSLQNANEIKRDAANFVDAISAEDLGKFPDQNVAESLQRITGVTINRVAGEGSRITVRGFGPEFNIVRFNDRTLATVTDERNFDFQVLPAEIISGAEVSKSPTADMWGGSIGGAVNLRTARPLDQPGMRIAGSAQGIYQDIAEDYGQRFTGVYSNSFADGVVGLLLAAAYEDRVIETQESRGGEGTVNGWELFNGRIDVTDPNSPSAQFRFPARMGQSFTTDDRRRLGVQATLEFEPSDRFKMAIDGVYVDYNRQSLLQGVIAPLQFPNFDAENLVINENGTAVSFTKNFAPLDIRYETDDQDSQTQALGWHGRLDATDRLSFEADLSWSRAEAYNEHFLIAPGVNNNNPWNNPLPPGTFENPNAGTQNPDFAVNQVVWTNGDVPSWSNSLDLTDPAILRAHVARSDAEQLEDEVFEFRFDGDLTIDRGIFESIAAGVFFSDREIGRLPFNDGVGPNGEDGPFGGNAQGPFDFAAGDVPLAQFNPSNPRTVTAGRFFQVPSDLFTLVTTDLLSEENAEFPNSFFLIDALGYCQWLRDNTLNQRICTLIPRPEQSSSVEEQVRGAYFRFDFEGEVAGLPWLANFGVRYEDTETAASGSSTELISIAALDPDGSNSGLVVTTTPVQQIAVDNAYSDWLPSANLRIELAPNVFLRLAAAKVVTRPGLGQIIPGQSFNQFNFESFARTGSNPTLNPYQALQFDGSLEFYADNGNAVSISVFYKDIDTFISEVTTVTDTGFDHPTFGDILVRDTGPKNRPGGAIEGVELAGVVNFDFLPGFWANFGVQANYTYVDSEDELANTELNLVLARLPSSGLEGFTPHAFNIVPFYEDETLRVRLAYNWRDTFLDVRSGPSGVPAHFDAYGQFDLGVGYKLGNAFELTFDFGNILNSNTIRFADVRERVLLNEYTGRRLFFGVRATF